MTSTIIRSGEFRAPVLALLLATSGAVCAQSDPTYAVGAIDIVDLGTLGGESYGTGINDHGDVVGYAKGSDGKFRAFIHADGVLLSLHAGSDFSNAYAEDINNSRQVVGSIYPTEGWGTAFFYQPGIWATPMSTDASYPMGYTWGAGALAINESGRIAGYAVRHAVPGETPPTDPPGKRCFDQVPVQWASSTTRPQKLFCAKDPGIAANVAGLEAEDINDSGNIVGRDEGVSAYSMFLFKNGVRYSVPAPTGLPTTNGSGGPASGVAYGINNKNHVAGVYTYWDAERSYPATRAYLWDDTAAPLTVNLGLPPSGIESRAFKVNEADMVVGSVATRPDHVNRVDSGFLWHKDFGFVLLPPLAYKPRSLLAQDCTANAISETFLGRVQIAGTCHTSTGAARAVRWDVTIKTTYQHR